MWLYVHTEKNKPDLLLREFYKAYLFVLRESDVACENWKL